MAVAWWDILAPRDSAQVIRRQKWEVAKARSLRLLARYYGENPGERDEAGRFAQGGGGGDGGGDGAAAPASSTAPIAGFKPGLAGRGNVAANVGLNKFFEASPFKDNIQGAITAAPAAQAQLVEAGNQIASEIPGVQFKNPGVKTNVDRIQEKVEAKGGAERVTDLARASFYIESPEQAQQIADKLAERFGIVEEDWKTTPVNYTDKALNIQFPNGLIGEMQMMHPIMAHAKSEAGGGGHNLYVEWREAVRDGNAARAESLARQQSTLYANAVDEIKGQSPAWNAVLGRGGR
jgi:hypothetical protein